MSESDSKLSEEVVREDSALEPEAAAVSDDHEKESSARVENAAAADATPGATLEEEEKERFTDPRFRWYIVNTFSGSEENST